MLMRNERLAALRTSFDEATHVLTIRYESREAARGDLRTPEGRAAIERFFAEFCADELRGPPRVLRARRPQLFRRGEEGGLDHQPRLGRGAGERGRRAGPSAALPRQPPCRGLAGLARVRPARRARSRSDRAARLKVVKRIVRCAATEVDPDTGDPRSADPARADGHLWPRRLRRLCRSDRRRRDRGGRRSPRRRHEAAPCAACGAARAAGWHASARDCGARQPGAARPCSAAAIVLAVLGPAIAIAIYAATRWDRAADPGRAGRPTSRCRRSRHRPDDDFDWLGWR